MYRHARRNAQEAIALARQKALEFDTQAAQERKNNETKTQLSTPDEPVDIEKEAEDSQPLNAPLLDRKSYSPRYYYLLLTFLQSIPMSSISKILPH